MSSSPSHPLPEKLANHIDNRPNIFANSFISIIILLVFYILGSLIFMTGLILLGEFSFRTDFAQAMFTDEIYKLFDLPGEGKEAIRNLFLFLGLSFTVIGLLFLLIARLTRMILRRNNYLLELVWIKEDIEEARRKVLQK